MLGFRTEPLTEHHSETLTEHSWNTLKKIPFRLKTRHALRGNGRSRTQFEESGKNKRKDNLSVYFKVARPVFRHRNRCGGGGSVNRRAFVRLYASAAAATPKSGTEQAIRTDGLDLRMSARKSA